MAFLNEYERLRNIGQGANASVYKVRHINLGYVRALKVSHNFIEDASDSKYLEFIKECKVLLNIGNGCHPNIVHIHRPLLIEHSAVVEMDYVDGLTVAKYLEKNPFVDMREVKRFALEMASALAYCHCDLYKFIMDPNVDNLEPDPDDGSRYLISPEKEKELQASYCVTHNDLHSNNIMRRNYDGNFILLDFGLAIQNEHCVKSSSRGAGAHEYSSPEKLDGKTATPASDVYSLGILLYEMLTGHVPFVLASPDDLSALSQLITKHHSATPPAILPEREKAFNKHHPGKKYTPDLPKGLEAVVMKCLAKDPADRYHNAKELLIALEQVFDTEASDACVAIPEGVEAAVVDTAPGVDNSAELAELRRQIDEADRRQHVAESTLDELRRKNRSLQTSNDELRNQIEVLRYSTNLHARSSFIGRPWWILSFVLMLVSVAWSFFVYDNVDYFFTGDALLDRITLGAGTLSLLGLVIIGVFPRANILFWCLSGMFMALTATLQYFGSFSSNVVLCAITSLALLFLILMWINIELHNKNR